jgi:hypothetical protein
MEPGLSTFDAEVKAIFRAVERIAETAIFPLRKTKFVILCPVHHQSGKLQ